MASSLDCSAASSVAEVSINSSVDQFRFDIMMRVHVFGVGDARG